MGLHRLRTNISVIPQDPLLFKGTLRKNVDPFEEYSDGDIWEALRRVIQVVNCFSYGTFLYQVKADEMIAIQKSGLEAKMEEGGSNLSVGERQLICFARAVLRKNELLVLDEATANVDMR